MTSTWTWTLRALALAVAAVAMLHGLMGSRAEGLLGVAVPTVAMLDANLDSQNRFFGVAFGVYAWVLLAAAQDLPRYRPVLSGTLVVFFLAGMARLGSVVHTGWPALPLVALMAVELVVPVVLGLWMQRMARPDGPRPWSPSP